MALNGTQTIDCRAADGRIQPIQGSPGGNLPIPVNFIVRLPDGGDTIVFANLTNIPATGLLVRREDGFEQRIFPIAT